MSSSSRMFGAYTLLAIAQLSPRFAVASTEVAYDPKGSDN
jgi:hypothetical protein